MSSPTPKSVNQKRSTEGALVTLSPAKRQKKDERHAQDYPQPGSQSVPEHIALPLRLTTLGGYLPLKDSGRFLLRVSKAMTAYVVEERVSLDKNGGADADDESVTALEAEVLRRRQAKIREQAWRCLCEQKWRNRNALKHLMSTLGVQSGSDTTMDGWERLFRKFLPSQPKPPIRASVEDYSFILSLFGRTDYAESSGSIPLTSFVLKGDEAAAYLRTGETGWLELDEPVKLPGNFASKDELLRTINKKEDDPVVGVQSTMHAIRQSDGKSCELNLSSFDRCDYYSDANEGWSASINHDDYSDDDEAIDHRKDDLGNTYLVVYNERIKELGKLTDIVDTTSRGMNVFDYLDVNFDRGLRTTISEGDDGTMQHAITHVSFTATIDTNEDDWRFPAPSCVKKGATLADFLEQLNVEWK